MTETDDLLREILREVRGLRTDLRRPGQAPTRADRDVLAILLPGISAAIGDRTFTSIELLEHAAVDALPLRDLERSLRPVTAPLYSRSQCFVYVAGDTCPQR